MFIPKSHIPTVTALALTLGACGDDKSSKNPSPDAGSNGASGAGGSGAGGAAGSTTGGAGGAAAGGAAGTGGTAAGGTGGASGAGGSAGAGGNAGGAGGSSGAGGVDPSVLEAYCMKFRECIPSYFDQYYSSVQDCVDTYTQYAESLISQKGDPCAEAINASFRCQSMLSCDEFAQYTGCDAEFMATYTECY